MSKFDPHTDDAEARRQIALFRYGLIADLVHLPRHHKGLYRQLETYLFSGATQPPRSHRRGRGEDVDDRRLGSA